MSSPQIFTFLGRAGSGKGTQAELLVKEFGFIYVGSGQMLRDLKNMDSFSGRKADRVMKEGKLVPTTLIFQQWINRLEDIKNKENKNFKGIVFDGSPRMIGEAELLRQALEWYEWEENARALLIDISREEAFNRLTKRRNCRECGQLIPYVGRYKTLEKCDKCGGELITRADDTPEAINLRLDLFEKEVAPVIDFYQKEGKLIKINGEQSIEDVYKEILEKIKTY
ncbi:MAG: Adenylate kinase [Parcubacteria group bacterium GW2011_GWC1_43_12]|nr:MAG: Adenylate kinase [Parcubacteria group bacterium GW2011_GWB1_42_6]KKS92157.1 MAG: Adenylate kinase [Parcubacteria group bacterium GW2011_GWC1_43_12]